MFGKSAKHYEKHFLVLLRSLPFKTWEEFVNGFAGMTCDLSDAERIGFEAALREHYRIAVDQDIIME
ncbi:hypothetical protein BGX20_006821, partial [Mortierella sp. AD010]